MPSIHQFTLAKVFLRVHINKNRELVCINMASVHLWCVSKVFYNQFLSLPRHKHTESISIHPGFNNTASECSITTKNVV